MESDLSERLKRVPRVPGVYFFYDGRGRLLYIGKAKRLRDRLRSYRRVDPRTAPENVAALAPRIREVRWQLCSSERAALRRESELLHAIRPPFNLAGVEPGHYLFIVLKRGKRCPATFGSAPVSAGKSRNSPKGVSVRTPFDMRLEFELT